MNQALIIHQVIASIFDLTDCYILYIITIICFTKNTISVYILMLSDVFSMYSDYQQYYCLMNFRFIKFHAKYNSLN